MRKKLCLLCAAICVICLVLTGCGGNSETLSGYHIVDVTVENFGVIRLQLDADAAPITVTNFIKLVRSGFYDGLTITRYQEAFVLQGGASTTETVASIKGEFALNGVDNTLQHTRGAISMARSTDYDSATSQFFIVIDDQAQSSLDGRYACFGYVIEGMDVVDAICEACATKEPINSYGFLNEEDQPIITSMRVVE